MPSPVTAISYKWKKIWAICHVISIHYHAIVALQRGWVCGLAIFNAVGHEQYRINYCIFTQAMVLSIQHILGLHRLLLPLYMSPVMTLPSMVSRVCLKV